jgi:predicted phage terminase large subunit-like protein
MKSINEYLKEVNYKDKTYLPSKEAIEFITFIEVFFGNKFTMQFPQVYYKIADFLYKNNTKNYSLNHRKALICSRGLGKTTLMQLSLLYCAAYNKIFGMNKVHFGIYVSADIKKSSKQLRANLIDLIDSSPAYQEIVPLSKLKFSANTNGKEYKINNEDFNEAIDGIVSSKTAGFDDSEIKIEFVNADGKPLYISLRSISTGSRGGQMYNMRPQFAILDDIISDQASFSTVLLDKINDLVSSNITPALDPRDRRIVWVGTPFSSKDPLCTIIEHNDYWQKALFPVAEKFPCEKEEYVSVWPEMFPYDSIIADYHNDKAIGKEKMFLRERMLQITSDDNLIIDKNKIIFIDENYINDDIYKMNIYITTDLAFTEKSHSDYSVISVWGVNHNDERILIDGFCGKLKFEMLLNKLLDFIQEYKPEAIGIEVTGQQIALTDIVRNNAHKRGLYVNIIEIRPTKDKFSRFNMMTGLFYAEKIKFSTKIKNTKYGEELIDELEKATIDGFKSKHDDIIDTISQLGDMYIIKPDEFFVKNNKKIKHNISRYQGLIF